MSLVTGTKLGRYEIRTQLGAGGMGEVYLAQDTSELGRTVALKILPAEVARDKDRLQRFTQEARTVSNLNHPNILTVYEFGQIESASFMATEYVDGVTLRQHLSNRRLKLVDVLDVAIQIVAALNAAHEAGVTHRDLKPENVMVRPDHIVKVLDFGLAKPSVPSADKQIDSEAGTKVLVHTEPGLVMGTVSYMSPEQSVGKGVDQRTDIWSFGVVLYEMIAGCVPFPGKDIHRQIIAIQEAEPAPLSQQVEGVPERLEEIVAKCLAKEKDERYQTAKDLLIDLRNLRRKLDVDAEIERTVAPQFRSTSGSVSRASTQRTKTDAGATNAAPAHPTSSAEYLVTGIKQHRLAVVAVVGVLFAGIVALGLHWRARSNNTEGAINSIAVLPFENRSGNPESEYLSDGLAESLIYRLSQLSNLKVSPRSSVFRYKGQAIDAEKIGHELGVDAVMSGRLIQRGDNLTISVDLVDVKNKKSLWGEQYERKMSDLLATQREIATAITEKLHLKLSGDEAKGLSKRYTENNEAYQAYLKGRYYWNKRDGENIRKAIEQFKSASDKDPNFALAYVGLADSFALLNEYAGIPTSESMPQAMAYAKRALEIDESLAEAHASLGAINDLSWNGDEAEREFKRAIELNPNYPTAQHWYALYLRNHGRAREALPVIKRAQELDPLSIIISAGVVEIYLTVGDVNSAFEQARKLIELAPDNWGPHHRLALVFLKQGKKTEALAEFQRALDLAKRSSFTLSYYGYALAVSGQRKEALAIVKELEEKYAKKAAGGRDIAYIYAGIGDKDQVFAWLERDFQTRSAALTELTVDTPMDSVRSDPRYEDLLHRMNWWH